MRLAPSDAALTHLMTYNYQAERIFSGDSLVSRVSVLALPSTGWCDVLVVLFDVVGAHAGHIGNVVDHGCIVSTTPGAAGPPSAKMKIMVSMSSLATIFTTLRRTLWLLGRLGTGMSRSCGTSWCT